MKNNPLDDLVKCSIEISSPASSDETFDSILVVVAPPAAADSTDTGEKKTMARVTAISQADELLDYGYTVEDPAYAAALVAFSQSPSPDELYICIRRKAESGGDTAESEGSTADASETEDSAAEAPDAGTPGGSGGGSDTEEPKVWENIQTTLSRAKAEAGFYGICLVGFRDPETIEGAVAWAEANEKLFAFEYLDPDACPVQNFSYYRSFCIYSGEADGYDDDKQPKENRYAALAWILSWFKVLWNSAGGVLSGFLDIIKGVANFISSVFTGDWQGAWEAVKQIFTGIWDVVVNYITAVWETLKLLFSMGLSVISALWKTVWGGISAFFRGIWDGIVSFLAGVFDSIRTGISERMERVRSAIMDGFQAAVDFIKGLPAQAVQWGADFIGGLIKGITSKMGAIGEAVKGVGGKIKSFLHFSVPDEGPLTDYESWMPDFMSGLAQGIRANEHLVLDQVQGLVDGISVLMQAATAQPATAAGSMVSNMSSNVTQNVNISNSYSGGSQEVQRNVSKAMKKSASDATTYMARGLAYARG